MLVISRRRGHSFTLHGPGTVEVLDVVDGKVRLGIRAPGSTAVTRDDQSPEAQAFVLEQAARCAAQGVPQ